MSKPKRSQSPKQRPKRQTTDRQTGKADDLVSVARRLECDEDKARF